jgi:hypothetical protein
LDSSDRTVRANLCGELRKRDWSEDRVYRRAGIGANLVAGKNLAASSSDEINLKQRSAKFSAAIYCGSCGRFCHDHFLMPDDESNRCVICSERANDVGQSI